MCAPPALAAVATVMSVVGTGLGALQANAQSRYQAKLAERNAGLEREAAQQEIANTKTGALDYYRRLSQAKADQQLAAAASGVAVDFGTAADIVADTDMLGREDLRRLYDQGNQRLRGRDIGLSNYMAEAGAQRQAGRGALVKSLFDMGSTALSGAQQYRNLRDKTKPAAGFG